MEILSDFGMLVYNTFKSFVSLGVVLGTLYFIFYFIFRFFCCGNSKSDYKRFRKSFNNTATNYAEALRELSVAHLDSAKLHAERIIARNNEKRKLKDY